MQAEQAKVFSHRGGNVTLPCKFYRNPSAFASGLHKIRIKWTKLTSDYLKEVDVFVSMGYHKKTYGGYQGRVFLKGGSDNDASLVITDLSLEDYGRYKCEVIEGLEDDTAVVALDLQGGYLYKSLNRKMVINHGSFLSPQVMCSGYHSNNVKLKSLCPGSLSVILYLAVCL